MIRWKGLEIDRVARSVRRGDAQVLFSSGHHGRPSIIFQIFCALLLDRPRTKPELFNHIYQHDPDGGPLDGWHIVDIYFCQLRPRMDVLGLVLRRDGLNTSHVYWLEPI